MYPISGADVDYMSLSKSISFEVGDTRMCEVIFTHNDGKCEFPECSFEHFFSYLNTSNYRVNLEPSKAAIYIKEDLVLQNCSKFHLKQKGCSPIFV